MRESKSDLTNRFYKVELGLKSTFLKLVFKANDFF